MLIMSQIHKYFVYVYIYKIYLQQSSYFDHLSIKITPKPNTKPTQQQEQTTSQPQTEITSKS